MTIVTKISHTEPEGMVKITPKKKLVVVLNPDFKPAKIKGVKFFIPNDTEMDNVRKLVNSDNHREAVELTIEIYRDIFDQLFKYMDKSVRKSIRNLAGEHSVCCADPTDWIPQFVIIPKNASIIKLAFIECMRKRVLPTFIECSNQKSLEQTLRLYDEYDVVSTDSSLVS